MEIRSEPPRLFRHLDQNISRLCRTAHFPRECDAGPACTILVFSHPTHMALPIRMGILAAYAKVWRDCRRGPDTTVFALALQMTVLGSSFAFCPSLRVFLPMVKTT